MSTLNLPQLLQNCNLSELQLATLLFPSHKYPKLALRYLVQGSRELKEREIEILNSVLNCPLDFVKDCNSWKAGVNPSDVVFYKRDYKALYDSETNKAKLLHNGAVVGEVMLVAKTCTISEFLNTLNTLTASYEAQTLNHE